MSKWYHFDKARLVAGAAVLTGLIGMWSPQASAGTLEMIVSSGATTFDVLDNGPLDTNPAVNQIQALATGLVFPDFNIVGLNASTNNPGAANPAGAVLTVGGEVQRSTGGGAATLSVVVTDTDYTIPLGSQLTLNSSNSATFSAVPAGGTSAFTSWFNPSNTPGAMDVPSPTGTLTSTSTNVNGSSNTAAPTPVGSSNPYGLTNETVITVGGATGAGIPDVVFGGSTQVLNAVPEPASLSLLAAGLPLAIWGWIKRRRLSLGS